ncbi:MAG TPA: hypothetical protein VHY84_10820 [Bryobacteraceae bacterium]|jgi:hypothetical protein|nr:hypothetical protein [Bryobacteraceae bacterium]
MDWKSGGYRNAGRYRNKRQEKRFMKTHMALVAMWPGILSGIEIVRR